MLKTMHIPTEEFRKNGVHCLRTFPVICARTAECSIIRGIHQPLLSTSLSSTFRNQCRIHSQESL